MTSFSLPAFAKLSPRIARTEREPALMEEYYESHSAQGDWGGGVSAVVGAVIALEGALREGDG